MICILHVFAKRMSHKSGFGKIGGMTHNLWPEINFGDFELQNTLTFYQDHDGIQKIWKIHQDLAEN